MDILTTEAELRAWRQQWDNPSDRVVLVPTMGALHEGHASLCRLAAQNGNRVVVSIFVNPLQFGPTEDLSRYPRPKEDDLALCRELGVSAVFYPTSEILYPNGLDNTTRVIPPASLTDRLCGVDRPGHFTGVATVVLSLFTLVQPQAAVFGQKDAQQLAIIRRMVSDLHVPVEIIEHPIVREADGLALSSRNRRLKTKDQREMALSLYKILSMAKERMPDRGKPFPASMMLENVIDHVTIKTYRSGVNFEIHYLEAVDPKTLEPVELLQPGVLLLIAAKVDDVRLIDNMLI